MQSPTGQRTVAIVGAGISGLATAYYLRKLADRGGPSSIRMQIFEAEDRAGGKLRTVDVGGLAVEAGADSFVVRKPWAVELCRDLGLEDRVIIPATLGAAVWSRGRLVDFPERAAFGVPGDLGTLLRWPGLSWRGKLRALQDILIPARAESQDEALGALTRRRLGLEASLVLVEPLLAGLHAGDPLRLSIQATFPELAGWERDHGSLMLGARAAVRAAERSATGRQPLFATLWGGLHELVLAVAGAVGGDVLAVDAPVRSVHSVEGRGFRVAAAGREAAADAVVLATPAFESARLARDVNPKAAEALSRIPYASTAVVILVYPPGTALRLPEDQSGFVVPVARTITAATWVSRKWPAAEFGDRAVVRCFVGRAGAVGALEQDDDALIAEVVDELDAAVGLGQPEHARVVRWERSMPQYEVGHLAVVERIRGTLAASPGLFVTGSAYDGVGIPDCIRRARDTAEAVVGFLASTVPAEAASHDEEATR